MTTQIARLRRWPYEWPADVPCHLRWPETMHETASWAYQSLIDNSRAPGTTFQPPVADAIATFSHKTGDLWYWKVEPSITPGFSETSLTARIIFENNEPKFYEWRYEIISGDMFLWFGSIVRTVWDMPGRRGFFPQAPELEFLVRNAAVEEERFRSFVTQPRTCQLAQSPVD